MNVMMQLRKVCNHPYLLDGAEDRVLAGARDRSPAAIASHLVKSSAKLILLDKLLTKLQQEGEKVLIFSQFKRMLDILQDYLRAQGWLHERLDGDVSG